MIRKRIVQLAVVFSNNALNSRPRVMLQVLEHILMMCTSGETAQNKTYSDAVKELQLDGTYELQRLARQMSDHLLVSQ